MFHLIPNEMFQCDCYGFGDSLHACLLPAIRHSGTKTYATAMQTGFLHSQRK